MKMNILFFLFFFLFFFDYVLAQSLALLNFLRGIAYSLCALFIILGVYDIVTSEGNPQKMESGKKAIIYALIGFGLALSVEQIVSMMRG